MADGGRLHARCDRLVGGGLGLVALAVSAVLVLMIGDLLWRGLAVIDWNFFVEDPRDAGRAGGIRSLIVSTLLILGVALAMVVPLGLTTAVLLAEYASAWPRFATLVRRCLDVLAGVPSIVFGLFGAAFFAKTLGLGYSILAGGLTLGCMCLPLFIRTAEASLRQVPDHLRLAAASLGLSRWRSIGRLILPAALPGLAAGLVLSIGRALAETAALIFTSGYVTRMPESLLDSGRALSVHIYDLAMNVPGGAERAAATAVVLVAVLLVLNLAVAGLVRRWHGGFWR